MSNGTVLSVVMANELPCSSSLFDLWRIVVDVRNREELPDRPEFEGNNRSRRLFSKPAGGAREGQAAEDGLGCLRCLQPPRNGGS
jgi:hypothetical protein